MKKLLLICALSLILLVSMVASNGEAMAATTSKYEIYPTPQVVNYGKTNCEIPSQLTLFLGKDLDDATKTHAYEALSELDVLAYTDGAQRNYTVYAGVYGSGDEADQYVKQHLKLDAALFEKTDAYLLDIAEDATVVLGKDTDAAFYGLTTLQAIFRQVDGNEFRQVNITDWSDCCYRGFIEGYYGVPWTTDERVELMRFGSQFKTNMYIYAPKDDPYHSSNWRGLYTEADLQNLSEQIVAGTQTKTRFVWAIHPFMYSVFKRENYDRDLNVLLKKLQQMYDAGVRQFALSADDITEQDTDAVLQKDLCNDIVKWLNQKGDCYNLIFVPTGYWYAKPDFDTLKYFSELLGSGSSALDPSVEIMWTGNTVCSTVQNGKFAEFSAMTGRKAFMWMNWPVNDYATTKPLFGKGEVYNAKLNKKGETDFSGIVTNPMQYAEADKIAVFATADYCWNVNGFDMDKSYRDSFKYIEKACPDDLYLLCQNLAVANKYEGRFFAESEQFVEDTAAFIEAYENGEDLTPTITSLSAKFRQIIEAAESYLSGCENQKLLENVRPFVQSLKCMSQAAVAYLEIYPQLDELTNQQLDDAFQAAEALRREMESCTTPVLNSITGNCDQKVVEVANAVIAPFFKTLVANVTDDVCLRTGGFTGIVYKGFDGIYQGSIENISDGDVNTHVWFNGYPQYGAFVRIDLGAVQEITDIQLFMGKVDGGDTWDCILEYSVDGRSFVALQDISGAYALVDLRSAPVSARFLRLTGKNTGHTWVAIREIVLNQTKCFVTFGNIELEKSVQTSVVYMIDGNEDTFTWFGINRTAGAYLQLEFVEVISVQEIKLLMTKADSPNDYFRGVTFSYSLDGENFVTIGSSAEKEIVLTLDAPVQLKYLRATATETCSYGIVIREFSVK